jgi:hypothetical protein
VSGRLSEEFWARKSADWEAELAAVGGQRAGLEAPRPLSSATGERILELAKKAEILYKSQNPAEQGRLLETVLSNCTFDRGTLFATYSKPFDLLVRGNETGDWRGRRDSCPLVESAGLGGVAEDGEPVNRPSKARDVGGVSGTSFATGWSGQHDLVRWAPQAQARVRAVGSSRGTRLFVLQGPDARDGAC